MTKETIKYDAESEESGLEYESATDTEYGCDTLVYSDQSDDDSLEDILDTPVLKPSAQV